jgi:ribonuclease HI
MIIIHSSIAKYYNIINFELGEEAAGRVQALRLNPKSGQGSGTQRRYDLPLNIINWHLEGDKQSQLNTLLRINNKVRTIAGGDCNFVITSEDAPSNNSSIIIGGKLKKVWDSVVDHLCLSEIPQPTHTHYFFPKDLDYDKVRTSRIDRIYISTDPADTALFHPITYIPEVPYSILRIMKKIKLNGGIGTSYVCDWVTDHLPITIQFIRNKDTRAVNTMPRWIADEKEFIDGVHSKLDSLLSGNDDPFNAFQLFSDTIENDALEFTKRAKGKKDKRRSDIASLHICFKALRMLTSATPNIKKIDELGKKHDFLTALLPPLDSLPLDDSKLRQHINALLVVEGDDSCELEEVFNDTLDSILSNLPPSTKAPRNKRVSEEVEEVRKNGNLRSGSRIHALRVDSSSHPTSDPIRIAGMLRDFWQKLGKVRKDAPSGELIDEYIKDFEVSIPQHLSPKMPSVDDIIDCIHASNNSCPGPDGIHFALIRPFAHKLAPIILAIIEHMANGNPPPPGFNHVLQFYFPKGSSLLAKDTRPISVANSVCRIIAKLMAKAISPAAETILRLAQKGFIPGRHIGDHVEDVTRLFYSKVEKKQQHFLLLLDTEKAFDSLDHGFIYKTLEKIGCPSWFINCYSGLLTDIEGIPVVATQTDIRIKLERGVKQGCPLSPIIFALCFDVLLHKLSRTLGHDHGDFAFADDLAISSGNFSTLLNCLHVIKTFSRFSGLGINYKKSVFLSATRHFYSDIVVRNEQGFKDIEFADKSKYLGVWIGRNVNTETVFEGAIVKFESRLEKLRPIIAKFGLKKRVRICNSYLLPIFYYLAQFYIIPWCYINRVKKALGRVVIPYNGGGFGYAHLVAPKNHGGPHSPLIDLWSFNYALLAQRFDLKPSHGSPRPVLGKFDYCNDYWKESMLIDEHRAMAAFTYMRDHNPRDPDNNINVSHITGPQKKMRKNIYRDLVLEAYWQGREAPTHKTSTHNKIKKIIPHDLNDTIPRRPHVQINRNINSISKHLTPYAWDLRLRLIYRALPTDERLFEAKQISKPDPCPLCGEGLDDIRHIYFECRVTFMAAKMVATATKTKFKVTPLHLLLIAPPAPIFVTMIVISYFLCAIWVQRTYYCKALAAPPNIENIAQRITDQTLNTLPGIGGARVDRPWDEGGGKGKSEREIIDIRANNPPRDRCVIAFTDGSALDNPGPSGAGIHITTPPTSHKYIDISIALALGLGDNNLGEMVAIYTAMKVIEEFYRKGDQDLMKQTPAMMFSDSLGCICYLTDTWPAPTDQNLARAARHLYQKLVTDYPLFRIYWIKGHSKITGNDVADSLAKAGSGYCEDNGNTTACVAPENFGDDSIENIVTGVILGEWNL